ncbi:MAG: lipopolysaccharide kinase InaA family protein [Acidobacteriota bacterium]
MTDRSTQSFDLDQWRGEKESRIQWGDLGAVIDRLIDPGSARETLHWGRNYLYVTELQLPNERLEVVVKQFRNQGAKRALDRKLRGSKAERSWLRAWQYLEAGVPTAAPLLWIESKEPQGPSFFISKHLGDTVEARYLLRARNVGHDSEDIPGFDFERFFDSLGRGLRQMHRGGLFHRDLSIGNVLVPKDVTAPDPEDLYIIDLNRSRRRARLGPLARARDLCRLKIDHAADQRLLFDGYWGGEAPLGAWTLYRLSRWAFLAKIDGKKKVRAPFKRFTHWLPRTTHAHIKPAPEGASVRDKIVWDHLSDQPHQHASRLQKTWIRLLDFPSQGRHLGVALLALPRILLRYRRLKSSLLDGPVEWPGAGLCVRPYPEAPEELLAAIDELGVRQVLIRLHPWQEEHGPEEELAKALHGRGLEIAYSLPQNRDLVRDTELWRRRIAELARLFIPYGRIFQVGQAVNRSKWGIWRYGEYLKLARIAAVELRAAGDVMVLGPAVIDFEPYATASMINQRGCPPLDGVASLLYVDRRGAPENEQAGFSGQDKALLCRAMAETARRSKPRSWITEVNWPLWEGPHSPAGRKVSVDEPTQADYLARFYLLALATGAAERVYWWQLVARGYGLMVPEAESTALRRRPAFLALRTLEAQLRGRRLVGMLPSPERSYLMRFVDGDGGELIVGWCADGDGEVELPAAPVEAFGQSGERVAAGDGRCVKVDQSVRYFRI